MAGLACSFNHLVGAAERQFSLGKIAQPISAVAGEAFEIWKCLLMTANVILLK
jgi:hypothetical protein